MSLNHNTFHFRTIVTRFPSTQVLLFAGSVLNSPTLLISFLFVGSSRAGHRGQVHKGRSDDRRERGVGGSSIIIILIIIAISFFIFHTERRFRKL